jgi:hypothetical protein
VFQLQLAEGFNLTPNFQINAHSSVCKVGLHPTNQHEKQEFTSGTQKMPGRWLQKPNNYNEILSGLDILD